MGCTLHKVHLAAMTTHEEVLEVIALVHVKGGAHGSSPPEDTPPLPRQRLHPGMSMRRSVCTEHMAWESLEIGCEDPGHVLQLCWARPDGGGEAPEDHPDHDLAPMEEEFPA